MTNNFDIDYVNATKEAECGFSTCRVCKAKAELSKHITIFIGGGLLYSLCLDCADRGESILIHKTERGICVSRKPSSGIVAATTRDLNAITSRVK